MGQQGFPRENFIAPSAFLTHVLIILSIENQFWVVVFFLSEVSATSNMKANCWLISPISSQLQSVKISVASGTSNVLGTVPLQHSCLKLCEGVI